MDEYSPEFQEAFNRLEKQGLITINKEDKFQTVLLKFQQLARNKYNPQSTKQLTALAVASEKRGVDAKLADLKLVHYTTAKGQDQVRWRNSAGRFQTPTGRLQVRLPEHRRPKTYQTEQVRKGRTETVWRNEKGQYTKRPSQKR